jgi:hypothetical protein
MSEPRWTPGPWTAHAFLVMAGYDRITHTGGNLPPPRAHESQANARLIAAAPELYEALEAAEHHLKETLAGPRWIDDCPVLRQVQLALAKAIGEPPRLSRRKQ